MKKLGALAVGAACLLIPLRLSSAQDPAAATAASAPASSPLVAEVLGPRSRLDEDLRVLTDEIGGRITGSAGYEKSLRWGQDAFRRAGVDSVNLEPYDAPARWEAGSASAMLVEPAQFSVSVVSFGLAPSTQGALTAPLVDAGEGRPADFRNLGSKAKGAIALIRSNPMSTFADLFAEYLAGPAMVKAAADSGAAAILYISTRPRTLRYRHMNSWDGHLAPLPMAQVAREDGQRLLRLLEKHGAAKLTLDLRNRVGGPWRPHNVVAEIRGSEKPDEVVLLGAHLDAWDLGTGALDNGVNCALVVEVARALAAGPRPRRTVRFVLFTGEETGLLGSRGYVAAHRDELDRHVAAVIHDIGDGRIRGYYDNGRPELAPAVRRILAPVAAWGADGTKDEALLGTDNFDFLLEGIPNFVADQETEKYLPEYHAESDTYDKVDLREARINAAIAAVMVSGLANAEAPVGRRQSRAEVAAVLQKGGLDAQMKTYGLWADWENGRRGRSARPGR
ncbi:MAG: M28 family peptidase [Thermoanaerobaculia bacterium]